MNAQLAQLHQQGLHQRSSCPARRFERRSAGAPRLCCSSGLAPLPRTSSSSVCALPHTRCSGSNRRRGIDTVPRAYSDGLGASSSDHLSAPQRVFMFDPSNPDSVQEMTVQPHQDIAAAEELLQAAEEEAQALQQSAGGGASSASASSSNGASSSGGNGAGQGATGRAMRTPIPLRAVSPMPARSTTPLGQRLASPLPQRATLASIGRGPGTMLATTGGSGGTSLAGGKSAELQKQLVAQLEMEQSQVAHLAQYESMYREWRVKAERLESDINSLQRLVAEKDAELAHGYRLLEASAAERSRLRHSYQAAQEQAKALQMQLNDVQLLGAGSQGPAGLLGAPGANGSNGKAAGSNGNGNGNGAAAAAPAAVPSDMQAMIEELTALARGLAVEMSDEVRTITRSPTRSPSL